MKRTLHPVVVSAKRYEDILGRSQMAHKRDMLAAEEEERRYLEYLKEGSDHLCSQFTNFGYMSMDEERQVKLDQELKEGEIRRKEGMKEDEELRKQRIKRAHFILENMKPGQRALHHALVESEMVYQRKYNADLNREIAEAEERQERFDEAQCPMTIPRIPFCGITEEQEKAVQQKKGQKLREYYVKELEERRKRRLDEKEQNETDGIIERAQYKCLQDIEEKEARELAKKKRDACNRAYEEMLKNKADRERYEKACDSIEDRVICVDKVKSRKLDLRAAEALKTIRQKVIQDREEHAKQLFRVQQAKKRQDDELQHEIVDRYNAKVLADRDQRLLRIKKLSKERIAYQKVERQEAQQKIERDNEIKRFYLAERMKNDDTNKRFALSEKRKKDEATANLRDLLYGQRDEFLRQRDQELLHMSASDPDPYLQEDVGFFEDAVKMMTHARQGGRSVYPIAKAVQEYRRKNQIDKVPEGRMVGRSKIRDYCWPGYYSKADLAYRKYEQREQCRKNQETNRHDIFAKCIKITNMAAEENPSKKCKIECPGKYFKHRGIPDLDVDSF